MGNAATHARRLEGCSLARAVGRRFADRVVVPGAPDLILLWADGGAMVELKRPRSRDLLGRVTPAGRASAAQSELAGRAPRLGINHAIVSSWEELHARLAE